MPKTLNYTLISTRSNGVSYPGLQVYLASTESLRDTKGRLVLRSNPFSLSVVVRNEDAWESIPGGERVSPEYQGSPSSSQILRAQAIAESDLRGKLARQIRNKEGASLGVSIASSKQSIEMLRSSSVRLTSIFSAAEQFYRTSRGRNRLKRLRRLITRGHNLTAGMVLEGFFGWAPLLDDWESTLTVLGNPWPPAWASAKVPWKVGEVSWSAVSGFHARTGVWSAHGTSSYACKVHVVNPNYWVANKLGLVNPFSVAWDLVPWSFLINMVSNMSQIMGSLTDFTGLSLSDPCLTTSTFITERADTNWTYPGRRSTASGQKYTKLRYRQTGVGPPAVTPYLRFPEWNVGTAAIAGALMLQKARKLDDIVRSRTEHIWR